MGPCYNRRMDGTGQPPGAADVEYFTEAQAGSWADTLRAFARFVAVQPGWSVLDVGSGPGLLPRLCAEAGARLAVACDDSWPMAARAADLARGIAQVSPLVGDAVRLPVRRGTFDAVTATNLLFLLPDPGAGLTALAGACRAGGLVAFLNPGSGMGVAAAEQFAEARGLTGFARFSFVNYGRLAEEHHRLGEQQWLALAGFAGLSGLRSQARAGGLILFVSGRKRE